MMAPRAGEHVEASGAGNLLRDARMSLHALALVLLGALLHAVWNFHAKQAAGGAPFVWLYGVVSLLTAGPVAWWLWEGHATPFGAAGWTMIVLSGVIHLVYALLLQHAYSVADLSVVYPVARGSGPLFSVVGAILLLAEMPTRGGALGIAMIIGGVLCIAGVGRLVRHGRLVSPQGVGWGLLTGVTIAAYTVVDGWAIKRLGLSPLPYYVVQLLVRNGLLTPIVLARPAELKRQARAYAVPIVVVGVLAPTAYGLVLYALRIAPLSYVAPARELALMFGAVAGMWLLGEERSWGRIAGAALMTGGVVMLNLGG